MIFSPTLVVLNHIQLWISFGRDLTTCEQLREPSMLGLMISIGLFSADNHGSIHIDVRFIAIIGYV